MNYGQAIEAMKRGGLVKRSVAGAIRIAHHGTPLQYLAYEDGMPFNPSVADQLAEDWQEAA
ncbi:DUF2829 domain-containing protein [Rhizobium sullae]|uniref:DUF2829 domain-containing protein n=1 Tax=Rhizobium sullae TaxID=50338 RepID=A0A2N0D330_RHISU|nr:DUF2829 domain-containing protein [Rhizobium sullae]PKA40467.1 DUF2829 domain-containing protein [Rhizobium sullae]